MGETVKVGGMRITYSVHTAPGADPGGNTKENQDAWVVKERVSAAQDMAFFGVFDGHGQEGRAVSNHVCTAVPRLLARSALCKPPTLESCLSASFVEANRSLRRLAAVDCDLSGSTGIAAVVTAGNKLVVANLGDSRCVAGCVEVRSGRVAAVPLSSDHTPMDQAEADRVLASGGRIASYMFNDEPLGPPRVWLRDLNVPGLCMTRSFGDAVAATVGVIDSPDVVTYPLKPEDRRAGLLCSYVVLMSDGIFEFMDSQEVVAMVHTLAQQGHGPNEAAKQLVREARRRWQQEEQDIIDDCTAMVLHIAHQAPSAAHHGANGGGSSSGGGVVGSSGSNGGGGGGAASAGAGLAGRLEGALRLGLGGGGDGSSNSGGAAGARPGGSGSGSGSGSGHVGSLSSKQAVGLLGYGRR
ncbi:Protein phosphatase 2C containing protein [Monoraphidium neglectum]|uniref:protein-serine/threonine phosphatase n=1 Tax=Monoraphidium neglectum TaxID=145388 RepID=A0A0D2JEU1_9CHLO|nr:Protein phosphatase 2C containing protein [Monoraphidium neglectum]KIY98047.1 Protein phosphatase 2C containing protein [Monoraphidium neglectum]|eukprot:XP_013897067.1 Protein phosphatase 2C containing protein [Monoraphidium neglectum]